MYSPRMLKLQDTTYTTEQKVRKTNCHTDISILCVCVLCAGSVDLDSSGNLRPSPSQGSAKMAALQRALHGKEVSFCMQLKV